ncbi:MAG: hypothetical protein UY47_C0004G0004 [Parcubacteria group bacterium GW2011_GWB1_49_7]|uniref:Uncharacterized protein n=1 Tax=Candidatus Zambryskibacteria bacterium RIFCSPHIGHO2_01_FULL_46_25 TaxID=1802738 RepID=A0A1G2T193_9BACT|nr:MAG: hypothetical protein UX71_C0002G0108 [Parcubacteria group bacterium GW2011_GWA1_47_10]KKW09830.1 MAG: hypothetical protein UY47_C0004G0004 [Parcubacteria group bacterium GW2011_GWB1_49_7]OHA90609.1 MAG: hypothetical protein A2838_02720 [Candidatus Zambryskibacteria bacterium RIFCSPHIGHO2_01_FULL_46_25]OHB01800.1 MAG: hypothetical protein A3F53_00655 [Candidatus Zambryskibacteria bacterium RIFCSPHIGHO2_12_FULL_48_10]OHB07252.1 MAG: hypothetical protein A3A31_01860 [Candidatus Zambryskiba
MERKNFILFSTLILAIAVTILHVLAGALYLYWTYWWFDWVTHFLTGFTGALGIYWGLFLSGLIFHREPGNKFFAGALVFFFVMLVGAGWEIFEYSNDITDSYESSYGLDVLVDLIMDASGAVLAVLVVWRKNNG